MPRRFSLFMDRVEIGQKLMLADGYVQVQAILLILQGSKQLLFQLRKCQFKLRTKAEIETGGCCRI